MWRSFESPEVLLHAGDHSFVAGDVVVPAAFRSVVAQRHDVGELVTDDRLELRAGDEVVALLADVGVGAGAGGLLARAVAVGPGAS